jgi:hypothetical protein
MKEENTMQFISPSGYVLMSLIEQRAIRYGYFNAHSGHENGYTKN